MPWSLRSKAASTTSLPRDRLWAVSRLAVRYSRRFFRSIMNLELDLADGVVDGAQDRQHHPAQERAEDDRHGRFDHHLDLADGILHVAVVEVGPVSYTHLTLPTIYSV